MSFKIYPIDPNAPDPSLVDKAANVITGGGVLIFPTQSLYGLGANALDQKAVDRIFAIKERPSGKPLLVLIDSTKQLDSLVLETPPAARRIMKTFWPGSVTIVLHAKPELPANLTAGTSKIGIRLPLHPVAREVVRCAATPITGTSANLSGRTGCSRVSEIDPLLLEKVDMTLDAGSLKGGSGSTIIDVTVSPPKILREGLLPASQIIEAISGL